MSQSSDAAILAALQRVRDVGQGPSFASFPFTSFPFAATSLSMQSPNFNSVPLAQQHQLQQHQQYQRPPFASSLSSSTSSSSSSLSPISLWPTTASFARPSPAAPVLTSTNTASAWKEQSMPKKPPRKKPRLVKPHDDEARAKADVTSNLQSSSIAMPRRSTTDSAAALYASMPAPPPQALNNIFRPQASLWPGPIPGSRAAAATSAATPRSTLPSAAQPFAKLASSGPIYPSFTASSLSSASASSASSVSSESSESEAAVKPMYSRQSGFMGGAFISEESVFLRQPAISSEPVLLNPGARPVSLSASNSSPAKTPELTKKTTKRRRSASETKTTKTKKQSPVRQLVPESKADVVLAKPVQSSEETAISKSPSPAKERVSLTKPSPPKTPSPQNMRTTTAETEAATEKPTRANKKTSPLEENVSKEANSTILATETTPVRKTVKKTLASKKPTSTKKKAPAKRVSSAKRSTPTKIVEDKTDKEKEEEKNDEEEVEKTGGTASGKTPAKTPSRPRRAAASKTPQLSEKSKSNASSSSKKKPAARSASKRTNLKKEPSSKKATKSTASSSPESAPLQTRSSSTKASSANSEAASSTNPPKANSVPDALLEANPLATLSSLAAAAAAITRSPPSENAAPRTRPRKPAPKNSKLVAQQPKQEQEPKRSGGSKAKGAASKGKKHKASKPVVETDEDATQAQKSDTETQGEKNLATKDRDLQREMRKCPLWSPYFRRLREYLRKINFEKTVLDTYEREGWRSANLEKMRPEKELAQSRRRVVLYKAKIHTLLKDLMEGEEAQKEVTLKEGDKDGLSFEHIHCSRCQGGDSDNDDNDIVMCDLEGCNKAFHQECCDPPVSKAEVESEDDWFCRRCLCMLGCLNEINEVLSTNFDDWHDVYPESETTAELEKLDAEANAKADEHRSRRSGRRIRKPAVVTKAAWDTHSFKSSESEGDEDFDTGDEEELDNAMETGDEEDDIDDTDAGLILDFKRARPKVDYRALAAQMFKGEEDEDAMDGYDAPTGRNKKSKGVESTLDEDYEEGKNYPSSPDANLRDIYHE